MTKNIYFYGKKVGSLDRYQRGWSTRRQNELNARMVNILFSLIIGSFVFLMGGAMYYQGMIK